MAGTVNITGSAISVGSNIYTKNSDITINNPLTLTSDAQINSGAGAGNILIVGTVDGAQGLTVSSGTGSTTDIGATTGLTSLNVSGTNVSLNDIGDADTVGVTGVTTVIDSGTTQYTGTTYKANAQTYNAATIRLLQVAPPPSLLLQIISNSRLQILP